MDDVATADQTRTAAFRRWFADSRAVDERGEPLVLFRGASEPLTRVKTRDEVMAEFDAATRWMSPGDTLLEKSREDKKRKAGALWFSDN